VNKSQKLLNSIFLFSAIFLLLLTGCSKQRDIKTLKNLNSRPFDFEEQKENAKVGIKILSEKEFSSTFSNASSRKKKQVYKDYKIMLVDLANKSDYMSYLIDPKNIGFSFTNAEEIFAKLKMDKNSALVDYIPFLITFLGLVPINAMMWCEIISGAACFPAHIIALGFFTISTAIILTTLLIGMFKSKKFKQEIERRNICTLASLKQKIFDFDQTEELGPNTGINKLFFINKKDLKPEFTINLFNEIQQSYLVFNIPLLAQTF